MRKKKINISKGGASDDINHLNKITISIHEAISETVTTITKNLKYLNRAINKLKKLNKDHNLDGQHEKLVASLKIYCEVLDELYSKCREEIRIQTLKIDDKCMYENELRKMGIK